MTRLSFAFAVAALVAGCAPATLPERTPPDLAVQTRAISTATLFGPPRPLPPERANAQIVQDVLELGFRLESGRELPFFSRFEGPVTLRLRGAIPPLGAIETDRLIARIRTEARLDITRTDADSARIVVDFVPRATMRRTVPEAACFIIPNVSSFDEFRANLRSERLDWARVSEREKVLVVVPADSTVQDMRDCLHEEIAQALGPLNDLYRIPETVWNDDNFQTSLTGYDMLILRIWNAPELRPGMTRAQVSALLPTLVARLNPAGQRRAGQLDTVPTPRIWTDAIEATLGAPDRRTAFNNARLALDFAQSQVWMDERLAFSLFLWARHAPPQAGRSALDAMISAATIYTARPGGRVHEAHIQLHLAAQALASGQYRLVLELTRAASPIARRTENGALLSSLMLLEAQALEALGRENDAARLRREALPYALFGFGSDRAAAGRVEEIAALVNDAL